MSDIVQLNSITSIDQLRSYANGKIVELPSFAEGQPFTARLIRPSLLQLVKSGKIPNSLLVTANDLFKNSGGAIDVDDKESLGNIFAVMETMCDATFLEPTYSEIQAAGITLTDDQMMFIFNYTQVGVKALDSFRTE